MQNTPATIDVYPHLSDQETQALARLEESISDGLKAFVKAGCSLMQIRDLQLYRSTDRTFENYCQRRWGLTPQYCNRLIGASAVVQNLETIVSDLPKNESQCRPLTALSSDQQRKVWTQLTSEIPPSEITTSHVEQAVETLQLEADRNKRYQKAKKIYLDFLSGNPDVFGTKVKVSQVFRWLESQKKPLPERQQKILMEDLRVFLKGLEESSPVENVQPESKALELASTLASYSEQELAEGLERMGQKYLCEVFSLLTPKMNPSEIKDSQQGKDLANRLYSIAEKLDDCFGID